MSTCNYCGLENTADERECARCGALLPRAVAPVVDVERDAAECPSCSVVNTTSAEYCTQCGTPMAVITRVLELVSHHERGPLETWRVYGIETQMVARREAMAALHAAHEATLETGRARFVAVRARTGLGKSRLLSEFGRELDQRFSETVLVPVECCVVTSGLFHMFSMWFKKRFYISERDPVAVASRRLMEAVGALLGRERAEDVARISSMVGHMMGFPMGEDLHDQPAAAPSPAGLFDRRRFEAVADLLRADAARNPLIIALEDLQYATDQSLKLLAFLRRTLEQAPVMFLLSWNPDELYADHELGALVFDEELELEPLSDEDVEALVKQTLHRVERLPEALLDKIVESAQGNPLAVEEMMRLLIGEGTIDTRQQAWTVDEARVAKLKLPQTVGAAVKARIGALSEPERELLRMASCVGDSFWPRLMTCVWRLSGDMSGEMGPHDWGHDAARERVAALLESLERKDIIRRREDAVVGEREEYFFKHRMERKTIYNALVSRRKRRFHRLIAQWLERELEPARRGPMLERIAQHYDRARSLERAARHYIEAADWARTRYSNRKAIALYTCGLAYLGDAEVDLKLRALHDLGSVHDLLGEFDQSLAYYRELRRYAWLLDDHSKGGVALNKIGRAYRSLGEFDDALECLDESLEHFQEAQDLRGIASTLDDIGKVHWIRGHYEEALRYYTAALALRRRLERPRSIALSLNHIGSLHLQRGALRDAMIYFREALDIRRGIDDRQGLSESFNNLGILCMERGDYDQAHTLFEEALETAQEIGYRAMQGIVLNNLGETLMYLGERGRAHGLLEQALGVAEESGEKRLIFDILRNLGQVAMRQGDRDAALESTAKALQVARELGARGLEGVGLQNTAEVHARYIFHERHGELSSREAQRHYEQAMRALEEVGHTAQLGRCLAGFGQFLVEQGEVIKGKQTLERARAIFERLEMRKLSDATQHTLGAL